MAQSILVKPILKKCDLIFYPGRKTFEYFVNLGVSKEKLRFFHDTSLVLERNSINIRKKYGISSEQKILLFLGRAVDYKGIDVLLKAYSQCPSSFIEKYTLLIAGDGAALEKNIQLAEKVITKKVVFTGAISPKERYSYFEQCNIFVHLAKIWNGKIEAWGLVINEAIQFGKIIISTTAVGSAFELIFNGINGYQVEENNVNDLTTALLKSNNENLAKSAYEKDKQISNIYTYERMADDFIRSMLL